MARDPSSIEDHRAEVERAKRRLLVPAAGGQATSDARPIVPSRAGVGERILGAAIANPAAAASIGVAVVCLLGVGGTAAIVARAVRLATFAVAVTRVLKAPRG